jgi:hypothetical protein
MPRDAVIAENCRLNGTDNVSNLKEYIEKILDLLCNGIDYWKEDGIPLLGNTWRCRDTIHVTQEIG